MSEDSTSRSRPRIETPKDTLVPRPDLAAELGVAPKTVARMKLPTVYIANFAYHPHKESLTIIAARARTPKGGR